MDVTSPKHTACCSSPASTRYWLVASVIAWALLSLVGLFWRPLGPYSASTILLATGVGCAANWRRNRTFHCGITAPILVVGGALFLLGDVGILSVPLRLVWAFVGAGVAIAFVLERMYAAPSPPGDGARER